MLVIAELVRHDKNLYEWSPEQNLVKSSCAKALNAVIFQHSAAWNCMSIRANLLSRLHAL